MDNRTKLVTLTEEQRLLQAIAVSVRSDALVWEACRAFSTK